jgi:hypothetical protein
MLRRFGVIDLLNAGMKERSREMVPECSYGSVFVVLLV